MKLETFFEKFDQFADAPDAVAKVRELIFELAAAGRLLPEILERPVEEDISLLEEVADLVMGQAPPGDECNTNGQGTTFVKVGEFGPLYPSEEVWTTRPLKFAKRGDVLICVVGATVGKLNLAIDCAIGRSVAAIRPSSGIETKFLYYSLIPYTLRLRGNSRGSAQGVIGKAELNAVSLWIPSLSVQRSMVAKVDELMALCDRLEAQQKERETRHAALTRAAIARFDEAPTPANLNFLFHPSYSVNPADLRKTILNLAVRGKLFPQDSDRESVDELLERVCEERRRLKRKNSNDEVPSSSESSLGYDIPQSWRWQNLGKILIFGPTNGFSPKSVEYETGVRSLTLTATTSGRFRGEHCKFVPIDVPLNSDLWLRDGDILVQRGNTLEYVGVSAVYRGKPNTYIYPDLMMKLRVSDQLDVSFIHLAMSANPSREFLRAHASGTSGSMPKINQATLTSLPIPVPPLLEQRRIVARADQLMGLVDQLEAQLAASEKAAKDLLDAVVHELLHPTADAVELPRSELDRTSQRAAIGCYAIEHLLRNPSFGHTMNMKVVYMAQAHIGLPLDLTFERQAAGPWHPWIEEFDAIGRREGWFTVTQKPIGDGHTKYEYTPKAALKMKAAEAVTVLGTHKAEFDRMLGLFADLNTEKAEIVATLFAAWNDFLIDGKSPSDDAIIREVRTNWHESKKRFTPDKLAGWLKWMRKNRLIPQGCGPRTQQQ